MNNVYHTDGYCNLNGSSHSVGGITIYKNDELLLTEEIPERGVTSNECELRALAYAIKDAAEGDEIVVDSMVCVYWTKSGNPKARLDLKPLCTELKELINEKKLDVYWAPREENLAGHYNEESYQA